MVSFTNYNVFTHTHTYTEQNYKHNTFVFSPFFHELNSKIFFYVHKRPNSLKYCSQICVSEHFSFAEIIHLHFWGFVDTECWSTPLQWLCEVAGYW